MKDMREVGARSSLSYLIERRPDIYLSEIKPGRQQPKAVRFITADVVKGNETS